MMSAQEAIAKIANHRQGRASYSLPTLYEAKHAIAASFEVAHANQDGRLLHKLETYFDIAVDEIQTLEDS